MSADILRLDLRRRRRGLLWYTLGFGAYTLLIVALYPTFRNDTALDAVTEGDSTLAALFGATGSLTSPNGWLSANIYANFLPLIVLLMTIGYGAEAIAGQDEAGLLGMVASLPVSRHRLVAEKLAALTLLAAPVPLVTLAFVVAGRGFDLRLDVSPLVGVTLGVVLMGLDFGLLAMLVGAASGSRGLALGVAAAVAATSYVVSSLAPVTNWVQPLRFGSLFFYSVGDHQLVDGLSVPAAAVLACTGVVLALLAGRAFARFDIH